MRTGSLDLRADHHLSQPYQHEPRSTGSKPTTHRLSVLADQTGAFVSVATVHRPIHHDAFVGDAPEDQRRPRASVQQATVERTL